MQNRVFEKQGIKYKKCKNCNVEKEVKDLKPNWYSKNWTKIYKPLCKYCFSIEIHNDTILKPPRYWRRISNRRKYENDNREKMREYGREYYEKNKEILKRKTRNFYRLKKENDDN